MKKLGVSLVAVLIGLPMIAKADAITQVALLGNPAGTVATNRNVATTSYVKGAYNDLAGHINTNVAAINILNGDASTTGSVAKAVADGVAGKQDTIDAQHKLSADVVDDTSTTNKFVTASDKATWNAKQEQLVNDAETPANISATVKTTVGAATGQNAASDEVLVTEKAVREAIDTAKSATTYTQGSGIAISNNEISASGITTSNIAANAGIVKTQLDSTVQTSLGKADTALQANSTLDGANLDAGSVEKTALANDVQTSLGLADSAVQSVTTGDAESGNGTIKVDGTAVSVYGLGSAAFVNTNAIAGTSGTFNDTTAQLGTTSIQGAIEAVAASAATANGTKGFNVYGNWATPDTATGHVNVAAESGLEANP